MQVFLIVIVLVALVALTIRVLHGIEQRRSRDLAEQTTPLPPLSDMPATETSLRVLDEMGTAQPSSAATWQEEVKTLRDSGRYQDAIRLCSRQYPKQLAFRQTLITLRARVREEHDASEETLEDIYETALMASLSRLSGSKPARSDIEKIAACRHRLQEIWQQLGYQNLDMLTKTDQRLLTEHWGEPAGHADVTRLLDQH
jgi:hypothetical protein